MIAATDPFREQIGAYLLHRLDDEDQRRLEDHLGGCAACRQQVNELADLPDLLGVLTGADRDGLLAKVGPTGWPGGSENGTGDLGSGGDEVAAPAPVPPPDLLDRVLARGEASQAVSAAPQKTPAAARRGAPVRPLVETGASRMTRPGTQRPGWARWAVPLTAAAAAAAAGAVYVAGGSRGGGVPPRAERAVSVLAPPAGSAVTVRGELELAATERGSRVRMQLRGAVPGTRCVLVLFTRDGRQRQVAAWVASPSGGAEVNATTDLRPAQVPRVRVETVGHRLLLTGTVATT